MTRTAASPVCRLTHTAIMLAVIGLGTAAAFGIAVSLGGPARIAGLAAGIVAAASLVSLLPGLLHLKAENWGLAVLGASMARMLLVLAVGFAADPDGGRRAFWMGLVAGAVVVLVAETGLTVSTLQKLEREKRSSPAASGAGREQVQA
ncbi:MAG: hypothetical protein IT436_17860 [Phycisphaerales bacterium]|nr:hypothetical protein [Phycisphaerales bacterium]